MLRLRCLSLVTALLIPIPLAAEKLVLELDPRQTAIEFTFGATLHTVKGSLSLTLGRIEVDPEAGTADGRIVMSATSADTGNSRRDAKMHEKILESERYPNIVFDVERVTGTLKRSGRSELQLHGVLDFHGSRRQVAVPAVANVQGNQVTAEAYLIVPYVEWGLADPSFFILRVAKEVRVDIRTAGRLLHPEAGAAPH
ncbi:MAG TPA: YceI family protein [Thermoanaerobaculia bacterium]|nr:YceI family protein [Thermoanaerobaculia bacterium]